MLHGNRWPGLLGRGPTLCGRALPCFQKQRKGWAGEYPWRQSIRKAKGRHTLGARIPARLFPVLPPDQKRADDQSAKPDYRLSYHSVDKSLTTRYPEPIFGPIGTH